MAAKFEYTEYQESYQAAGKNSGMDYLIAAVLVDFTLYATEESVVFAFGQFTRFYGLFDDIFGGSTSVSFYFVKKDGYQKIKTITGVKENTSATVAITEIMALLGENRTAGYLCAFSDHDMNCSYSVTSKPEQISTELIAYQKDFDEEIAGQTVIPEFPGSETIQKVADSVNESLEKAKEGSGAIASVARAVDSFSRLVIICVALSVGGFIYYKGKQIQKVIME